MNDHNTHFMTTQLHLFTLIYIREYIYLAWGVTIALIQVELPGPFEFS